MKLVLLEPNRPQREISVIYVNGRRLVSAEGVFIVTPACDERGQTISGGAPLPAFMLVEVSPIIAPPDLTEKYPAEAADLYEKHLACCRKHDMQPRTVEQHKEWARAELERVFGLPDDLRPYCLTIQEQVILIHGRQDENDIHWRAFFKSGDLVTKWFLKDFQPTAPLMAETQIHRPEDEAILRHVLDVKEDTAQTRRGVSTLVGSKKEKDRKLRQEGGKATAKWKGHEAELAEMAREGRTYLNRDWKKNGVQRGKMKFAIAKVKSWWGKKYQGERLESYLRDKNNGWIRRMILKCWSKDRKVQN